MAANLTKAERDALDRAQDLIYDAWEAPSAKKRAAAAKKALTMSPFCADAHCLLAQLSRPGSTLELEHWRAAVEVGRRAIGDADFKQMRGRFWGYLETRPFMRGMAGLAEALWARGDRQQAVELWQEMLRLNPGDNQGVRYELAARLVELGHDADVAKLLKRYRREGSAFMLWAAALAAFRASGACADSRKALERALASNAHAAGYLIGLYKMPKFLPPYYGLGDENEAILHAHMFGAAWMQTAGALEWLATAQVDLLAEKAREVVASSIH